MSGNVAAIVDGIGDLKAQIALLTEKERELKNQLIAMGVGRYSGTAFDATVSESERESIDLAAVREHVSRQWLQAHTSVSTVTSVRVVARKRAA